MGLEDTESLELIAPYYHPNRRLVKRDHLEELSLEAKKRFFRLRRKQIQEVIDRNPDSELTDPVTGLPVLATGDRQETSGDQVAPRSIPARQGRPPRRRDFPRDSAGRFV